MRLRRLALKAFGPFTERTLEFSSQAPGLHIIFGLNEAGKSSSLRALKALLYGFPERTSDNFQHAGKQLLIGGSIEGEDGKKLSFLRRKKRKGDLLDEQGEPLDASVLAAFMHGVEPALFEAIYGLDHKSLIVGGEDILAQKGEVGQALFAAGAGVSSLAGILESLEEEADALFRERGSKQKINAAIREYLELRKIVREKSLPPSRWKEHQKRLREAEENQARLEEESRQKASILQRLVRLSRAIPEMAELENLQEQLHEIGEVVMLPPDFTELLREVEQDIRDVGLKIDNSSDRLKKLLEKQGDISVNRKLLEHAEAIEDLHQRIGEYRKGRQDRVRLEGMRITHRQAAGTRIESIRPDLKLEDAELLRPVLGRKRTIQGLIARYEALGQQASQADKQKELIEKEYKDLTDRVSRLPALRNGDDLAQALVLARKIGDIDQQIEDSSREIEFGRKSCSMELKRLGLWEGTLEQLSALALPLIESVRRFEAVFIAVEREKQQLTQMRRQVETEVKTARSDLMEVAHGKEIPTEQNLAESRQMRQDGWHLLRREWLEKEDVSKEAAEYDSTRTLPDAYEVHVQKSDLIADRLWREAERIARAEALQVKIETLEERIREIREQEEDLAEHEKDASARWHAAWETTGIKPLSSMEMLSWLSDVDIIRFKITEILNKEHYLAARKQTRQNHFNELIQKLDALEETPLVAGHRLAPLLVQADSILAGLSSQKQEGEKLIEKQAQVAAALAKAETEQKSARTARLEWQNKWDRALADLGIRDLVLPGEALDILDTIAECFTHLERAKELQSRIDGIDRDSKKFSEDVTTLTGQVAPELQSLSTDQAALQLQTMLVRASQADELLKKNTQEIESLGGEIASAEKTLKSRQAGLADLLAVARCREADELPAVIGRFKQYQRLQENISNAQAALAKVSEGFSLAELKSQAAEVEVDELAGRIESLRRLIDEDLYARIRDAIRLSGEESKELMLMDGSAEALEAADKMEQVATNIQNHVDQYVKTRLAAKVLKEEIERYREENQDPVLTIASRIFAEITLGSFVGLRSDVSDAGSPVLVGLRPDESRVAVQGMSDGTRDQLYLALRLATLEWRLESSEPIPLIVDDILVNFDDDRSRATLSVLAQLSVQNQVLLFTHHQQVVDEARKLQGKADIVIHEL